MVADKSIFIVKSRKGYQTRMSLVGAAFDLIADDGVKMLTISSICERVGLQRSSFYTHFENLEALLDTLVHQVLDDGGQRAQAAFDNQDDIPSLFEFRIRFLFQLAMDEPAYACLIYELYTFYPPTVARVKARVFSDIEAAMKQGQIDITKREADALKHIFVASMIDALRRLTKHDANNDQMDQLLSLLFRITDRTINQHPE